jgi:CHAT domain-containing protein
MVLNRFVQCVIVAALLSGVASASAQVTTPVDTLSMEAREAIMADVVAKTDSLGQESFARWLYERGREAETQNLLVSKIYYDTYLNSLIGSTIIEYSIPTTYDRMSFWQMITANIKKVQRFAIQYVDRYPIFGQTIYNYELFSKSLQLRSSRTIEKKLANIGNPKLTAFWESIKKDRESLEMTNAFLRESQSGINEKRMSALPEDTVKVHEFDSIKAMRDRMDNVVSVAEVMVMSEIYNRDTTGVSAEAYFNWKVVQNALSRNHAIVEYMTCPDEKGDTSYYAIVLRDNMNYPSLIEIAQENQIHRYLKDTIDYRSLHDILWTPVEPLLENTTEVYVIPAGIIHRVPFAGMHDDEGYLCDRYKLHCLLSGKDVIDHNTDGARFVGKTALLVGGADYDMMPETDASGILSVGNREEGEIIHAALRSVRGQGFGYLPGSLQEVDSIADMLGGNGWEAGLLTDTNATESALRIHLETGTPEIVHISTHGFIIPVPVGENDSNRNIYRTSENPLMRCGLLFSGANVLWNKDYDPEISDDGVLTALELSRLDLSHTRLVVLSACNTALGETDPSEGVYGLQRALRLAGAGAMIVSLWEVSDRETADFMQSFYTHLIEGRTPKEAFDATQKKARLENPDSLHLWAGFVMIE